ncbi:hypothetical protein R75461_05272 [Paraburkholderia nemoris]|uniref:hypothetical protein n=1 Tax=Paraburkholderia nemoris TaxID=2793076 RepID=UPI00190CA5DD|nr:MULTISPECIES: hypothetical protein [Paraburkholderia]CAE6802871.1 hypothetical protein R75461_05272 [Paraburkholderia nemoris]
MATTCGDFGKAFTANMNALGLPAPSSLFGSIQAAASNVATMLGALKTLGPGATVAELIGATTALEVLSVVGALSASFYVGACIGSLVVAANAAMKCTSGTAAATARATAARVGLVIPDTMLAFIQRHPEVMIDSPSRGNYAFLASRAQPSSQKAAA